MTDTDYFQIGDKDALDSLADEMAATCVEPSPHLMVSVTIPAKNEEDSICDCLTSLALQKDSFGAVDRTKFEIIIFCHNCTDATKSVCSEFSKQNPTIHIIILESDKALINNVGAVRRVLMRIAESRSRSPSGFIAMTDADSILHPYWMANLFGYHASDYGLICGKIHVDTDNCSLAVKRALALKAEYALLRNQLLNHSVANSWDPAPRHSDNSGPNMVVRVDVYTKVGGMPAIGFCEDVAFYDAVVWGGFKVRHCPLTEVSTSARTCARAPWGFGAELGSWENTEGFFFDVEGLAALKTRNAIFKAIMTYQGTDNRKLLHTVCQLSGIESVLVWSYLKEYSSPLAINHRVEKDLDNLATWRSKFPKIPVMEACHQLRSYLSAPLPSFFATPEDDTVPCVGLPAHEGHLS